jgi:glycosyltransferase involved in cell wall biosynthesis
VTIGSGLHGLFYLRLASNQAGVWYPADEMFTAAVSQFRFTNSLTQHRILVGQAARLLLFERLSRDIPDQTWVVAERDRRAMRRILGSRDVVSIPNGVDLELFAPGDWEPRPNTAVFWGRLDFGPNEQALEFFLTRVWPSVLAAKPDARLLVMGYAPSVTVRRLTAAPGVELLADVPDIRPIVLSAPVALYPFVSGTGIKNKLLEGAALGRALLVSPTAIDGLRPPERDAWEVCSSPSIWRDALLALWQDSERARSLGAAARAWVERHYSWERAGAQAEENLERVLARRRASA